MRVRRLRAGDVALAGSVFAMMGEVFDDDWLAVSDNYVIDLLDRPDLWMYAALDANHDPVGGLVAHQLPMTRAETTELLIYDLAVRIDSQRQGVGRALISQLRNDAVAANVGDVWVPADDDDQHALDFYRATGGHGQPVTIFTYTGKAEPTAGLGRTQPG